MLNLMVLVGKVKEIPEIRLTAAGTKIATMLLEVDRGFRNSNGEYDQDVFNVVLWRGVAETCADLLRPGSVVAVKGRLQAHNYEPKEGQTYYNAEIVAEKVSFISVKPISNPPLAEMAV